MLRRRTTAVAVAALSAVSLLAATTSPTSGHSTSRWTMS
jgi:hypothetical protein